MNKYIYMTSSNNIRCQYIDMLNNNIDCLVKQNGTVYMKTSSNSVDKVQNMCDSVCNKIQNREKKYFNVSENIKQDSIKNIDVDVNNNVTKQK